MKARFRRYTAKTKFMQRTIGFSTLVVGVLVAGVLSFTLGQKVYGEQGGNSPTSPTTSYIKTVYDTAQTAGYGTDTNTPDWGTYWNRIATASQWVPSGATATASDIVSGKTAYTTSRTTTTGTNNLFSLPTTTGSCSTQAYHDSYGAPVTQTTNCVNNVTWTTADPAVTGDDKKDPRSGLVWSRALLNSAGTVTFTTGAPSDWSWDASGTNNIAVGNKTASQLCSDRGNGWRLPTQKELMQAYIDGSYFNLSQTSTNFWSATENSSSNAWIVSLNNGYTISLNKTNYLYVRCVR